MIILIFVGNLQWFYWILFLRAAASKSLSRKYVISCKVKALTRRNGLRGSRIASLWKWLHQIAWFLRIGKLLKYWLLKVSKNQCIDKKKNSGLIHKMNFRITKWVQIALNRKFYFINIINPVHLQLHVQTGSV